MPEPKPNGERPPLLGVLVVLVALVVMLMLAHASMTTGRGLDMGWAGLLAVLLGVPLGLQTVRRRRADDAGEDAPALDAPPAPPLEPPAAPALDVGRADT